MASTVSCYINLFGPHPYIDKIQIITFVLVFLLSETRHASMSGKLTEQKMQAWIIPVFTCGTTLFAVTRLGRQGMPKC